VTRARGRIGLGLSLAGLSAIIMRPGCFKAWPGGARASGSVSDSRRPPSQAAAAAVPVAWGHGDRASDSDRHRDRDS
jgi:hypothetical protein